MEKISLPNGKTLTIPSDISPENRELLQKQIKQRFDIDINAMPVSEQAVQLGQDLARGVAQTTLDIPLGLAGLLDVGNDSKFIKNLQERKRYLAEDSVVAADPRMADSNLSLIAQGLGSTVPFLGAGLLARPLAKAGLTKTATAVPFAVAAPTGVARQVELQDRARELGEEVGGGQEIFAELLGGGVGLTEALPIANLLRRTSKTELKNFGLREKIKSAALGAGVEGSQEAIASLAQDLIARGVYSDELPIAESLMEEFMVGATVGGIIDVGLNTFAGRRGISNQSYKEQEKQLRENKVSIQESNKFKKAIEQGEVEQLAPVTEVKPVPEIPIPLVEDIQTTELETIQTTDGSTILFDTVADEEIGRFDNEAKALTAKQKEINKRIANNLKLRIENDLYSQGLINSATAFEVGQLSLDPNSTNLKASAIFNYHSKVPENATADQKAKLFKKFGLDQNKTYSMEEARKILPTKDFNDLQSNLADIVFKESIKEGKPAIDKDKSEVNVTSKYLKDFAASKNIDLDFNDPAVRDFSKKVTGYDNVNKATKGAKKLFLSRLHSLPSFNVKTKLPDFRQRKYSALDMANFVSNAKANKIQFSLKDIKDASPNIMTLVEKPDAEASEQFLRDLQESGRVQPVEGKPNKFEIKDNFEYDMARKAEGFNETVEEFEARLRNENNLSEDAIQKLVEQETVRQEQFLPPIETNPKIINFSQAVEEGKKTKFAREIRKLLDGVGLKETGVVVSNDILSTESLVQLPDGTIAQDTSLVEGRESTYDAETDTIFISLSAINPDGTLTEAEIEQKITSQVDGEIVRALREKDLFTEKEYTFLRQYVKRTKVPEGFDPQFKNQTFYQRSKNINQNKAQNMQVLLGQDKDAQEEMFVEEAIADLYRSRPFLKNKPPKLERTHQKILQFFKTVGQAMQRATIGDAGELLSSIEQGGVGIRERGTIRTLKEVDRIALADELRPGINIGESRDDVIEQPDETPTRTEDGSLAIPTVSPATPSVFSYYQDITPDGVKGISMPFPIRTTEPETETTEPQVPYDEITLTDEQRKAENSLILKSIGNKNLIGAMDWLIKNAPSADYKLLAQRVNNQLKALKKAIREFGETDFDFRLIFDDFTNPKKALSISDRNYLKNQRPLGVQMEDSLSDISTQVRLPMNSRIYINTALPSGPTFDTLLHEAIHAATSSAMTMGRISDSTVNTKRAKKLYNDLEKMRTNLRGKVNDYLRNEFDSYEEREKVRGQIKYGLKNADEFLAMGLTNRQFQKFMESVKYSPKDTKNIWQKFTDTIRNFLNVPAKLDTAFSQFLYLSDVALTPDIATGTPPRDPPLKTYQGSINNSSSLLQFIKDNPDGFTVDPLSLESPRSGFAVAPIKPAEVIVDMNDLTISKVREFVDTLEQLSKISGVPVFAGGWFNNEDGKYYLDAVYNIDNKEDALYTAQAGDQIAIFDLGEFNEINTEQGIQELKETGRYSSESERQQRENTRKLTEAFQRARNRSQGRLISNESTFDREKRYATEPNTSENKKLVEATQKAEEIARSSPNGFIPPYNTNASDVALKTALEFNEENTIINAREVPYEQGTVPPELEPLVVKTGYVDSDNSFFTRVSDSIGDVGNIRNAWTSFRVQFIDKLSALEQKLLKLAETNDSIRDLNNNVVTNAIANLRLADRARGIFQSMLNIGSPFDLIDDEASIVGVRPLEIDTKYNPFIEGDKGFGGLTQITSPLYADPSVNREAIFNVYGGLKRKVSLDKQGREVETPFSQADLEKINFIEANFPSVVEVYNNYQKWNNEIIKLAESKGLLNEFKYRENILDELREMQEKGSITEDNLKTYAGLDDEMLRDVAERLGIDTRGASQLWQDHSSYYPFYRRMIDDNVQAPNIASGSLPSNPLGIRLEGSEEGFFVNPIEAISRNSLAILTASLKNDGVKKLLDSFAEAGTIDEGGLVERLDSPAQANGVDTITVFEDGRKTFYATNDIALFEALRAVGGESMNFFGNFLARPASFLRDMVTRDPGFVVANLIRDTLSVAVTSGVRIGDVDEGGYLPVYDTFKNMFGDMKELEQFGIIGGYDFQNDEGSVKDYIRRSQRAQGLNAENAGTAEELFYKLWDGLGALTTKSDGATRKAVYSAVYQDLKNRGASEAQAQSEAAYQALEIINFGRRGLSPTFRIVTAAIPFLNARIQGLDVLGRAFTGKYSAIDKLDEGQTREDLKRQIFTKTLLRGATLASITLLYYALVSDTEEYRKARREERDDNWIIPLPADAGRLLIPIPFEVGLLFKAFPERFIDEFIGRQVEQDPLASIRRGAETSLNIPFLQPAFGVQILKPIGEYITNRNSFTGNEIVPYYQLKLEDELQYRETTNEFAKKIAQTLGLSPLKVENLLRSYTGTLGSYLLDAADITTRKITGEPIMPLNFDNIPAIKRIFRPGTRSAGGLQQQFYELRSEVDTVVQSMNALRKQGRTDEYYAYKNTMRGVLGIKGQVRALERYMDSWRKKRDRLLRRNDISANLKADLLEQLESQRDARLSVIPILRERAEIPFFRI